MSPRHFVVAILLVLSAWIRPVQADTITWGFAGRVTFVQPSLVDYLPLLGTDIHGWLTFDSDAPDLLPSPTIGHYRTGPWVINLPGLDSTWTYAGGFIEVLTQSNPACIVQPFTCFVFGSLGPAFSSNGPPPLGNIEFRSSRGLPTDVLPLVPPNLPVLPFGFFPGVFPIAGTVTDLHVIPEPTSIALVASGLMPLIGLARRHRRGHPNRVRLGKS